jgi:hypothetical protein
MIPSENIATSFGISRDEFDRVGQLVYDHSDCHVTDIRRILLRVFGMCISEGHYSAMYFHLGASLAAEESDIFKHNILDLWQRVN